MGGPAAEPLVGVGVGVAVMAMRNSACLVGVEEELTALAAVPLSCTDHVCSGLLGLR